MGRSGAGVKLLQRRHRLPRHRPWEAAAERSRGADRILLIGHTDGGRALTLVLERTARSCTPDQIEIHKGDPGAKLSILASVEGDDAKRLELTYSAADQPG
jgi:hypothetical protein